MKRNMENSLNWCVGRTLRLLLTCYRYIELNPVRAGMVAAPGEYKWSSYDAHAYGRSNGLLRDHACYLALGENGAVRQQAY